jgi:hypothetical protein
MSIKKVCERLREDKWIKRAALRASFAANVAAVVQFCVWAVRELTK